LKTLVNPAGYVAKTNNTKHKRTQKLLTHTETRNGKKILGDGSYPPTKVAGILQ